MLSLVVLSQAYGIWSTYGGDGFSSGIQEAKGAFDGEPVDAYSLRASGAVEFQFSAVADIDGDGLPEVVFGSEDGRVYAFKYQNWQYQLLWSFDASARIWSSPAVADIDGDGVGEVFFGTLGGKFYCLDGRSGFLEWSSQAGSSIPSAPKVADVDGDGNPEVIFGSYDGYAYSLDARTGNLKWRAYTGKVRSNIVAGDIDSDGSTEILLGTYDGSVLCLDGRGGGLIWAQYSLGNGDDYLQQIWDVNAFDVDGDGLREILVAVADTVYVISAYGSVLRRWGGFGEMHSAPLALDVDGDGQAEIVFGTFDDPWDPNPTGAIYCLKPFSGETLWVFPLADGVHCHTRISAADLNNDGSLELLAGAYNEDYSTDTLYVLKASNGQTLWKVPVAYDLHNPFAADPDADGCVEILVGAKGDYSLHIFEDPSFSSGCSPLYQGSEGSAKPKLTLRAEGSFVVLVLPRAQRVRVELYDVSGRLEGRLWDGFLGAGIHRFQVPKGLHIVKAAGAAAVVVNR